MDAIKAFLPEFDMRRGMPVPATPEPWEADNARRDAYIAGRAPHLAREWMGRLDKLREAAEWVGVPDDALAELAAGDDAEAGRLLRRALAERMRRMADDVAEDEAYTLVPERPL